LEIVVRPDAEKAAGFVAEMVATRLRSEPRAVLGLATGRTMEPVYARLVAMHRAGLSFAGCWTFNLDEYVGLSADDPRSYRATMDRLLFGPVDAVRVRTAVPDGMAADPELEAARYEAAIAAAGGIGLQVLGIGETGHIGFNEPPSPLGSRTRVVTLTAQTRAQNAPMFGGDPGAVPLRAITMGVGTILEAREIVLLATGEAKSQVLVRALEGKVTPDVSASALQGHGRCVVVADAAAARLVLGGDTEKLGSTTL